MATFTNRQGRVYSNVLIEKVDDEGILYRYSKDSGSYRVKLEELPDALLRDYGYDPVQVARHDFERAAASGLLRIADGVVYDMRKKQIGWVLFRNAKLIQQLEDAVLVDSTPDARSFEVIHVKNLTVLSDTERFSFYAKLIGSFNYESKLGNSRTVRSYDAGRICGRDEIPAQMIEQRLASVRVAAGSPSKGAAIPALDGDDVVSSGTGFFITEDGYLVTNDHVVRNATKLKVRTQTGTLNAELVRTSRAFDLALLKTQGRFKPLPLALHRSMRLGDSVFTIGFPNTTLQGLEPKFTDGKISSLSGMEDDPSQYQISVPIQPGNSGGPLVAEDGAVVGIVRAKINDLAALAVSGSIPQNVNYAVKVKYLGDLLDAVTGLADKIKNPETAGKSVDVVKHAQDATVMVLAY